MKIVSASVRFAPSASSDTAGYNLYWCTADQTLDYSSNKVDLGTPPIDIDSGLCDADLKEALTGQEGSFKVGVTAYDSIGNESDMSEGEVTVDFSAPDPPGPLSFVFA